MCGIAGILKFSEKECVDADDLRRMCAAMVHRGPDDEGTFVKGSVGLGMRRLSIIDVAHGRQPISNEDDSIWIVFNGEIYNQAELREQLISLGHRFKTHCDTEVIVHLYEQYGPDCVHKLRGMFAFAIWDARTKALFIARDRLGIKPLYYRLTADALVFGSEIKVLNACSRNPSIFNRAALPEFLAFGYLSGTETFYAGIKKLMPGHWLTIDERGRVNIRQYWDLSIPDKGPARKDSYYVGRYRELLEGAVNSHLMSEVPLGVFLSGGLDSSAIAALTTKIRRSPIETFSVGYSEHQYSELPYARMVADHLHSVHHEVLVGPRDFLSALPKLIWHEDEPLAWPSSVALYFVARLARRRVTVVLTGEGSDETLAGYGRYAFTLKNAALDRNYRRVIPRSMRTGIRRTIEHSLWMSATLNRKLSHTFLGRDGDSWSSFYFDNFFSAFGAREQAGLLSDKFDAGNIYRHVLDHWDHSSGEFLQRLLYTDIKTYLVELLMKQDSMSMAASVESRVPFLDHELVEFAMGIPKRLLVKGLVGKLILKKAVEDLLPASIVHRPKLGFPTPWSFWMAGPRLETVRNLLMEPRSLDREFFRPAALEQIFREHRGRQRDHSDRIWRLLNLELWHRVCIEGDPHQSLFREFEEPRLAAAS